jgi:haloacetate dehalogenase
MLDDFEALELPTAAGAVFARRGGSGPALLLLHGFPETHLMWRDVAPTLAADFTVVCADLPGYGASDCPASAPDHGPHAKRAAARSLARGMAWLGHDRFAVVGHDRGGRVAYRMALDLPQAVTGLAVLDVVPTETVWSRADARLALDFWPWSLLAQPALLPERILAAAAEAIVDDAVGGWGTPATAFPADVREAYAAPLRDAAHAHAICEEYRAAAGIDRDHDRADLAAGRRIACPTLALWGRGAVDNWYAAEGGPLGIWRDWCAEVRGRRIDGGHFFPEEKPAETAAELAQFFAGR